MLCTSVCFTHTKKNCLFSAKTFTKTFLDITNTTSTSVLATTIQASPNVNFREIVEFYPGKSRLPKPLQLSCSEILFNLTYLSNEPFARGFVKSVWLARLPSTKSLGIDDLEEIDDESDDNDFDDVYSVDVAQQRKSPRCVAEVNEFCEDS